MSSAETRTDDPWRALMHRWFVQYNPMYLLSATFVLGGIWLLLREAAQQHSTLGQLGVAGLAELYAFALIGGAAFLVRIGLRRPAVMLALLAALYQADLTLHVETCAYLGGAGKLASAAWLALFVVKIELLAWALRLRLSRAARLVPVLGAFGLAVIPHLLRAVPPTDARAWLISAWIFSTGAAGLWTARAVCGDVTFGVRARRSLLATWGMWAALGLGHALYWCFEHRVSALSVALPLALLSTRWMKREVAVWSVSAATLAAATLLLPSAAWVVAGLVGCTLLLRAWRSPRTVTPASDVSPRAPYRGSMVEPVTPPPVVVFGRATESAVARLTAGAMLAGYGAVWLFVINTPTLPPHSLLAFAALVVVCAACGARARRLAYAAPVLVVGAHLIAQRGWAPDGGAQWGALWVVLGFLCLLGSLVFSWRFRAAADDGVSPPEPARPPVVADRPRAPAGLS